MIQESCGPFTSEEWEIIVKLASEGKSHRRISMEMDLALGTINRKVKEIAARLPGNARPSMRVNTWFFHVHSGSTAMPQAKE
jgi:DNA-binding NarL/FixJ family response regulator